jgi:hypothetical protein
MLTAETPALHSHSGTPFASYKICLVPLKTPEKDPPSAHQQWQLLHFLHNSHRLLRIPIHLRSPALGSWGYASYGTPPSPTVPRILYCHGFPGSRLEAAIIADFSFSNPFRVLAIDRPGMGLSIFQPNRRILDWPADVLALMDWLKIERFHIVGDSGGAPYALVCAKEIPRTRILSVFIVFGIYSWHCLFRVVVHNLNRRSCF